MNVYGVSYKWHRPETLEPADSFNITFTYSSSHPDDGGMLHIPRTWRFSAPSYDGVEDARLGVSETRGLFGGISNTRQELYSEVTERAIGDVLTVCLCEILDTTQTAARTCIVILGPALPKAVGRLASLRPPANVTVLWVCPQVFPEWIAERANDALLIPRYRRSTAVLAAGDPWEDEDLLVGTEYMPKDMAQPCVVQRLQMWGTDPVDLADLNWLYAPFAEGPLPKEIGYAAGQAQLHLDKPYDGTREEKARGVDKEFIAMEQAPIVAEAHMRGQLPGWQLKWSRFREGS